MPSGSKPGQPKACPFPAASALFSSSGSAYFADSYCALIHYRGQTPLDLFLNTPAPGWSEWLMQLRNRLVQLLGLKNLGSFRHSGPQADAADFHPGDRVGIFTLYSHTAEEVILEDRDRHLNVQVSLLLTPEPDTDMAIVHISTVVHINNRLGRLYMLPVAPVHRKIVPAYMCNLPGYAGPVAAGQ